MEGSSSSTCVSHFCASPHLYHSAHSLRTTASLITSSTNGYDGSMMSTFRLRVGFGRSSIIADHSSQMVSNPCRNGMPHLITQMEARLVTLIFAFQDPTDMHHHLQLGLLSAIQVRCILHIDI